MDYVTALGAKMAVVAEVIGVLTPYASALCMPSVSQSDGVVTLTVSLDSSDLANSLDGLELYHALKYLQDVAQLRAIASRYGIDPVALEALLPQEPTT